MGVFDTTQANWGRAANVNGTCKAWANFKGTGTVALSSAFNVSTVTDNGTGEYTINYTTNMDDALYCVVTSGHESNTNTTTVTVGVDTATIAVGSVKIRCTSSASGAADFDSNHVAIFAD